MLLTWFVSGEPHLSGFWFRTELPSGVTPVPLLVCPLAAVQRGHRRESLQRLPRSPLHLPGLWRRYSGSGLRGPVQTRHPRRSLLQRCILSLAVRRLPSHSGCVSQSHVCVFCSAACPSSTNEQGAIYLNTGLTSTRNYGKTILTKVG